MLQSHVIYLLVVDRQPPKQQLYQHFVVCDAFVVPLCSYVQERVLEHSSRLPLDDSNWSFTYLFGSIIEYVQQSTTPYV